MGGRDLRVLELGREVGTRQAMLFASFSRNELREKKKKGNCFHGARRVPFSPSTVTERGKILMGPKTSPLFLYNSSPLHPHCGSGAVPRGGKKKRYKHLLDGGRGEDERHAASAFPLPLF